MDKKALVLAASLTAATSTPALSDQTNKEVDALKQEVSTICSNEVGKLKIQTGTKKSSEQLLAECIAQKSTKIEIGESNEQITVESREQLFAIMTTNGYSQETIDQALEDYDFLMQEKEAGMLVKYEIVPGYKSKEDLRLLVNDGNLLPEANFSDFLPEGDTELTSENYSYVIEQLSKLDDIDEWLRVGKGELSQPLSQVQIDAYKKEIKAFQKLYTRLPSTWKKEVQQGVLDTQAYQEFIDLFNQSKDQIVFSSRETLRRLLVSSASITKFTHLLSDEESSNPKKTAYLSRKIKPNISSQIWEYSMLTDQTEEEGSALKVTYSYEGDNKNGTRVYAYLPEQELAQLAQSLYSSDDRKAATIVGSSSDSMLVLQDRVANFKKRHASYIRKMELEAEKVRLAQRGEELAQRGEELEQRGKELEQRGKELEQRGKELAQRGKELAREKQYIKKMSDIMDKSMIIMANIEGFIKTGSLSEADTEFEMLNKLKQEATVLNVEIGQSSENFRKMYITYVSGLDELEKKYSEKSQLLTSL